MIDAAYIRDILKGYIDSGKKKFIIYPFGVNGINVRNILFDYFNLQPQFIVDNEYSKYNVNIIDKEKLKKVYHEDMFIILTIENEKINAELAEELYEFVPKSNIINFYARKKKKAEEKADEYALRQALCLQNILPKINVREYAVAQGKIKVRMTYSNSNFWNAIDLLSQAFREDPVFDFAIIIAAISDSEEEKIIGQLLGRGYRYFLFEQYQMELDKPDVLILTNSFDKVVTLETNSRIYSRLIIVQDMFLIWYRTKSADHFCEKQKKAYGKHRPDFYLYDSLLYQELKDSEYFSDKLVEMGNPKFDGIYGMVQKKEYSGRWEKLKGKKCVLWTIGHGIGINSFDLYAKTVFEYVSNHPEIGLIFRPHNAYIDELLDYGYWSRADVDKLKKYCDSTVNIVYDDTETYDVSMAISDGILTDVFCGIICSALPTLKPICVAYRSREVIPCHEELLKHYYYAYDTEDIERFFDMIRHGKDVMYSAREKACRTYIKNFDGKNSVRVREFIKKKYMELAESKE